MSAPVDRYTASSLAGSCKIKHPFRDTPFFVVPIVFLPSNSNPSPSPIFFASSSSFWVLSNHHHTHYPAPIFAAAFSFILSPDPFSITFNWTIYTLYPTHKPSLFVLFCSINHKLTLSATSKKLRCNQTDPSDLRTIHSLSLESLPRRSSTLRFRVRYTCIRIILNLYKTSVVYLKQSSTYDNRQPATVLHHEPYIHPRLNSQLSDLYFNTYLQLRASIGHL